MEVTGLRRVFNAVTGEGSLDGTTWHMAKFTKSPFWGNKGEGRGSFSIRIKQKTYSSWTHTNKHLQELRSTNGDERDIGFSGCGLS